MNVSRSARLFPSLLIIAALLTQGLTWSAPSATVEGHAPRQRSSDDDGGPPIELLAGTFVPEPGVDLALLSPDLTQAGGSIHVLLQMEYIPTPDERAALSAQGIELQVYVPQQAWIARVPAAVAATLAARPDIRWVGLWGPVQKQHPRVLVGDFAEWAVHEGGRVQVMVLLHADVSLAQGEALAAAHDGIVAGSISAPRALTVWIMPENLSALAAEEGVLWIEEGTPPLTPTNDDARRTLRVDAVQSAPYNLDGSDVKLFVFDGGTVNTHTAFTGRLTYVDAASSADHATHVAGTAAGDGSGSPTGRDLKGMAPAADIYSAGYQQFFGTMLFWDNAGDIEADYATARNTYGVDLATNSIGSNTAANDYPCDREGDYGVSSNMIDNVVRGDNATVSSAYISIWANGNERTGGSPRGRCGSNYLTTAPPACAKNPIHVGATNSDGDSMTSFSSWGPCDDGRLKPIVSGPGCESGRVSGEGFIHSTLPGDSYGGSGWCGTSMATPAVAGVASLGIQQYRNRIEDPSARPANALMKAWMIHTARDLGNDGPDYIYGYGEVNALAVMDLITSTANYTTALIPASGVTDTYTYQVPLDANELKVSLAWDDSAAAAFVANASVNNLDLEVRAPDGTIHYPFSLDPANPEAPATATGANDRDNQEQVVVRTPDPGTWTIRVRGSVVPEAPQGYALVYSHELGAPQCSQVINDGDFEAGAGGWTLNGAALESSPGTPPFGGTSSLRLGGSASTFHDAYRVVTIPTSINHSSNLSFAWYMTTNEGAIGHGYDYFVVELRDTGNNPLAVYELRNDGWLADTWLTGDNIDLTPFAGQTVRVAFFATNDSLETTAFYVDEVQLVLCEVPVPQPKVTLAPAELSNSQGIDQVLTQTLVISNTGLADLKWAFTETVSVLNLPAYVPATATAAAPGPQGRLTDYVKTAQLRPEVASFQAPVLPLRYAGMNGLIYYGDRTAFNSDFPSLQQEGFENGNVLTGTVKACPVPLDSSSNNDCFTPGDILDGLRFEDNPGPDATAGLVLIGANAFGSASKTVVANTFADSFDITFTAPVFAAGMDLVSYFDSDSVNITVYGPGDVLWGTTTATATNEGSFWGVASDQPFVRINIDTVTGQAEGVDNLAFGAAPRCGVSWASTDPITGTTASGTSTDVTVTFNATGLAGGAYTGTLCVESNDPLTPFSAVPLTMTVSPDANLWITKTAPLTATAGIAFTYTLGYGNLGPATAFTVTLTDTLPTGVDFEGVSNPGCIEAAGVITCDLGNLASGVSDTIHARVSAVDEGHYTNKAAIRSFSPDPDDANSNASVDTDVAVIYHKTYLPVILR